MTTTNRTIALTAILGVCAWGMGVLFWNQQFRYNLPTPVPASYKPVEVGSHVNLPSVLSQDRAYFFHFYNPDCACSRFNVKHLRELITAYSDSVAIVVVVPTTEARVLARREFGDDVMLIEDDGSFAAGVGVYSTPQAAIIDKQQRLFYRGNYNLSKYCTQRATNFAELSLIAMLNNNPPPVYGAASTQSYGCALPDPDAAEVTIF